MLARACPCSLLAPASRAAAVALTSAVLQLLRPLLAPAAILDRRPRAPPAACRAPARLQVSKEDYKEMQERREEARKALPDGESKRSAKEKIDDAW